MSSEQPPPNEVDAPLESGEVASTRLEIRLDDALKEAARLEAENVGEDLSEWVRTAIRLRLVQVATIRAVQAGVDPEAMLDPKRYAELLVELARLHGKP